MLDADRALEVGPLGGHDRGRAPGAAAPAAPAAAVHHHLGDDRPRHRARCSTRSRELYDKHAGRITTGELNRFLGELKEARQPPSKGDKRLNLLYGAQVTSRPPRFRFTVNDTSLVTRDYGYWVENELRERFELEGVPVAIDFRARS